MAGKEQLDDAKQDDVKEQTPESGDQGIKGKFSGILKYILFGVVGMVLIGSVVVVTLLMIGNGGQETTDTTEESTGVIKGSREASENGGNESDEDSILAQFGDDPSALENIMRNLEFLDYEPAPAEMGEEEYGMSVEDSIETVNWLNAEKARLAEKEKELGAREKELAILDKKVSQKLLKVEQAESGRVANLAKLYDGMDARAVAKLIANLDDGTVVSILPRMKLKNASQVLSLMPAKRAARLSKQMITIADK